MMVIAIVMVAACVMAGARAKGDGPVRVHSVTDISHEFSFYMDGRFATQYLASVGGQDGRNWGTLWKLDASNTNLLVLSSGATPCPYVPKDIDFVRRFLEAGGGVVVLGSYATFHGASEYQLNALAEAFGAYFSPTAPRAPLTPAAELGATEPVKFYGGTILRLKDEGEWKVLMRDANGRPMLARKAVGKGSLLVGSRGLAGQRPDASDPINADWWTPLLQDLARNKAVDASKPPNEQSAEHKVNREGLELQYSDYMEPYADVIMSLYKRERPVMEKVLGVPPAPGMLTALLLLPTGGGGFSSGDLIGLGVFWGDFPQKLYGMVELLGHEGTHSWVLPFPEPMWNEGIATYVGICVGRQMGVKDDAEATLKGWIDGARKHDPDMTKYDLAGGTDVPHVVEMAKPMWIFEQLRKDRPDVVARYFQAKRKLIDPAKMKAYTADDSVAVLSVAMGRDLFPWFQSLGIKVDRAKTKVAMEGM